jgi:hypothetical protein
VDEPDRKEAAGHPGSPPEERMIVPGVAWVDGDAAATCSRIFRFEKSRSPRKGAEVKDWNSVSCPVALVEMAGDDYVMRVSESPRGWIEIGDVGALLI